MAFFFAKEVYDIFDTNQKIQSIKKNWTGFALRIYEVMLDFV